MVTTYPVTLTPDTNHTVLVDFPDFPEAHTFGDTTEEALAHAVDALATVIDAYLRDRRPLPAPSDGEPRVRVPAMVALKVAVNDGMRAQRMTKAALARRLAWHLPQVDRILDVRHASRLDQIERVLEVLGCELLIQVKGPAAVQAPAVAPRMTSRQDPIAVRVHPHARAKPVAHATSARLGSRRTKSR